MKPGRSGGEENGTQGEENGTHAIISVRFGRPHSSFAAAGAAACAAECVLQASWAANRSFGKQRSPADCQRVKRGREGPAAGDLDSTEVHRTAQVHLPAIAGFAAMEGGYRRSNKTQAGGNTLASLDDERRREYRNVYDLPFARVFGSTVVPRRAKRRIGRGELAGFSRADWVGVHRREKPADSLGRRR